MPTEEGKWTTERRIGIITTSLTLGSTVMNITLVLPFLGFMVEDFGYAEQDIGTASGLIAAAFFLGRVFTSFAWGKAADRYGRRPVMLAGLLFGAVMQLMMGFCSSVPFAIGVRLALGLSNGTVSTGKTMMSELAPAGKRARAMSFASLSFVLGSIFGPAIGGLLARPVDRWPETFGDYQLLVDYPYLLPCAAGSAIIFCVLLLALCFMPETKHLKNEPQLLREGEVEEDLEAAGSLEMIRLDAKGEEEAAETAEEDERDSKAGEKQIVESSPKSGTSARELLRNTLVRRTLLVYCSVSLISNMRSEVTPLVMLTSRHNGGMQYSSQKIGTVLSVAGIMSATYQACIYPRLAKRAGAVFMVRGALLASIPMMLAIPALPTLMNYVSDTTAFVVAMMVLGLRSAVDMTYFTSIFMLVNNCVSSEQRGSLNGMAQAIASIPKMVGPVLGGSIWSWALRSFLPQPWDVLFVFMLAAALDSCCLLLSCRLPKSLSKSWEERHAGEA